MNILNDLNMSGKKEDPEIERLFEEAMHLRDSGRSLEAIDKLKRILSMSPRSEAPVLGAMAHIYYKLKDLDNALTCYQKTVVLSPKSELASLGLFHTLWNLGREWDAFEEAKRFLSIRDSEEYFRLVEEMRDSFSAIDGSDKPGITNITNH